MDGKHIVALCRKVIGTQIQILRAFGMSHAEIEKELKLRPNNGMTAWRLEGNKHKPK